MKSLLFLLRSLLYNKRYSIINIILFCTITDKILAQASIQLDTATVQAGTFRAIEIHPSGTFNVNNKFYLSVRTKITFSATIDASSPKFINEFVNEAIIDECRGKRKFCYEAPYQGLYPIVGDNRVIWNVETIYSVFSTSPYIKVDFTPTVSSTGSHLLVCNSCERDTIQIVNLLETPNNISYEVPREATVHHYFLVKNKKNEPVKDVIIKYQIDGNPEIISSPPTQESGLADLTVKVGGENFESGTDDKILSGTQKEIKFVDAVNLNKSYFLLTNAFENSFPISVSDKAQKNKKEFGLSSKLDLELKLKLEKEYKLPSLTFKAGFGSAGIGVSHGSAISIIPKTETLWNVKFNESIGVKASAEFKPQLKFSGIGDAGIGEGSVKLEWQGKNEYGVDINLNSRYDCLYFTAKTLNLLVEPTPAGFLTQNYLLRILEFVGLLKDHKSDKISSAIEVETKFSPLALNGKLSFGFFAEDKKGQGNSKNVGSFSIVGFSKDATVNYESALSFDNISKIRTSSNNYTAKKSSNSSIQIGGGIDKIFQFKNKSFYFNKDASLFQVSLKTDFDNNTNLLKSGSLDFSTVETVTLNSTNYDLARIFSHKYSSKVLKEIKHQYLVGGSNSIGSFMAASDFLPTFSYGLPYSSNQNIYKQIFDFNKFVFDNYQDNWTDSDLNISHKRKISKTSEAGIDFEIPLSPTSPLVLKYGLGYKSWEIFEHYEREFQYSKTLDTLLLTIDYPNIITNLELPTSSPFINFWNIVKDGLINTSTVEKNHGSAFVTTKEQTVSNSPITLSNASPQGQINRLSLNAKQIGNAITNFQKTSTAQTPSVFTFIIPSSGQAFSANTNINFFYYYPENQLFAKTVSDTLKLITDTFFLNAVDGVTELNTAPLGNFTINTQFSNYELELAGLPSNLVPRVLFLPNGSEIWEDIGVTNQTISFNRLGIFAIGVVLQGDSEPPLINVTAPSTFTNNDFFTVNIADNLSGIDWSKTAFICNGAIIPIVRNGTSNTFTISIADVPKNAQNIFDISVYTSDLTWHKQEYNNTYPCTNSMVFDNLVGSFDSNLNKHQASESIQVNGFAKVPPSAELKAGKSILLNSGFEITPTSGYFKAEIGGCNTSGAPAQPANFTTSSAAVCKGQAGVVYAVPAVSVVTYNWSYSGTGATINGSSNSITINFAANATAGTLSVTVTNGAGTSPALTLAITITAPPTAPNINSATGATASVLASGCTTYKWYDQATNGTLLFTGNPFITPTLNANTTYHVACADTPCPETARTAVTVTVGALPPQPAAIVGSGTACQGRAGIAYLVPAVAGATSYTWTYSGTGINFVGGISNTRTITIDFGYAATSGVLSVTANNTFGQSTARTMAITLSPAPPPPTASGATIASGAAASLTATGCSIYKWYTQASGGTAFTGQNFTTPALNTTTTYYVACNPGTSCESPRVPVVVTVQ